MKIKNDGFTGIEFVIIIAVLGLIFGAGWYVWKQDRNTSVVSSVEKAQAKDSAPTTEEQTTLEIPEWGVKLVSKYSDRLTYKIIDQDGTLSKGDMDAYDSRAELSFKSGVVDDQSCMPGFDLYRLKGSPKTADTAELIGGVYYASDGAPGPCSNDPENHDDVVKSEVINDFSMSNLKEL